SGGGRRPAAAPSPSRSCDRRRNRPPRICRRRDRAAPGPRDPQRWRTISAPAPGRQRHAGGTSRRAAARPAITLDLGSLSLLPVERVAGAATVLAHGVEGVGDLLLVAGGRSRLQVRRQARKFFRLRFEIVEVVPDFLLGGSLGDVVVNAGARQEKARNLARGFLDRRGVLGYIVRRSGVRLDEIVDRLRRRAVALHQLLAFGDGVCPA